MKRKMFSAFYMVMMILVTGIFVIAGAVIIGNEYYKNIDRANYQADSLRTEFDNVLNSYLDICQNISTNPLVTEMLYSEGEYTIKEFMDDNTFLKKYFSSFREIENYVPDQFCIYLENYEEVQSAYMKHISSLEENMQARLMEAENYEFIWEYGGTKHKKYLSLYRRIYAPNASGAYLEIKIPLERLVRSFKNIASGDHIAVKLVSESGEELYYNGEEYAGTVKFKRTAANGDTVQLEADIHRLMQGAYLTVFLLLIIYIVLVFGIKIFAERIVQRITGELNEFMDLIHNDDSLMLNSELIDIKGESDIKDIKIKFKELIESNNKLHENIEIANRKRQHAELNFLQYSINPHLLYNSLSCIKWCVMEKSEDEISDIIDSITEYYRIVLSGGENFVTVREELRLICRYTAIMSIVYGTPISIETNVAEEIYDTYTIKMLLQPIVENSVLHGLAGVEDAKIVIEVKEIGEDIIFSVSDNGYGMSDETIKGILSENKDKKRKNYGIKNVLNRIKCYYGDDCELNIQSSPGHGSEVKIRIKKLTNPINDEEI